MTSLREADQGGVIQASLRDARRGWLTRVDTSLRRIDDALNLALLDGADDEACVDTFEGNGRSSRHRLSWRTH